MISRNPGHEFDNLFYKDTEYIFWGAAKNGLECLIRYSHLIDIKKVVDSGEDKIGRDLRGFKVESPDTVKYAENIVVIVTCDHYPQIRPILEEKGYTHNKNLFTHQAFIPISDWYLFGFVQSYRIDISLTEKCTLRCEKCNMFMPLFKNPSHQPLINVKRDLDVYFRVVGNVSHMNLLGGEPFLYPDFKEILNYIGLKYRQRIDELAIFTNGMILPDDELLDIFSRYNVTVVFSDYTEILPRIKKVFDKFILLLERNKVLYRMSDIGIWSDFGFPDNPKELQTEEKTADFFASCCPPFRGLYDGKVYFCHLETSAMRAGLYNDEDYDSFNLNREITPELKKEFIEFDLGFISTGYISFCKVCRGCGIAVNPLISPVAVQA
jgi:hypothetical protein